MTSESISLTAAVAPVVSFAMHQASVPVIGELRLKNESEETVDGLTVSMTCEPPVIGERRWTFDRIAAGSELAPSDRTVSLDGGLLYKLSERMQATVTIRVMRGETQFAESVHSIVALARHEWGGSVSTPELLAAFVTPNDPGVAEILRNASNILREGGRNPSLEGYQSQSRARVWEIASAIWNVVASRRLTYVEPPASFERDGQKIRLPSEVLEYGLATCLDTAVLLAAALEQSGLRPLLCLTRGHALTALWLQPSTLLGVTTDDASDLRNYVALKELIIFETTVITHEPPATFSQALQLGAAQIRPDLDDSFVLALDIRQARARRILPLPAEIERVEGDENIKSVSLPLELPPTLPNFTAEEQDAKVPETSQGRLDAWKRRLLDLTKRSRLLNLKPSKTAIRLVCTDPGKLEDSLASGGKITIVPFESLSGRGGGRDQSHLLVQQKVDFEQELASQALANNQLPARLGDSELKAGIVELFRKSKSDMEEGGANTLFLAIGMLRWREAETSNSWHLAPLLLVPVRLERATAASPPRVVQHTDDTVFNMTLLEMLRQDHDLRLPQLEGELPTDDHGVDVNLVLEIVRKAIRDVPGWEVLDETVLSTFSFSKYLMWKDLNDHTDALRDTAFVKHMIDTPRNLYSRTPEFIQAREQDARIDPAMLLTPLSCDSSQIAAIHASGFEGDFVLEGPPGTGKSQTIANLIAHNLGLGRKVLFVAEKMTALNVVQERLKRVGLGDFCLELHSSKASKKSVLAQLDSAWTRRGDVSQEAWGDEAEKLKNVRASLNGLVSALHTPGDTGISPRQAIARAALSRFGPAVRLDWNVALSADQAKDRAGLEQLRVLTRELGQAYGQTTAEDAQVFVSLRHSDWSYQWQSEITLSAAALVSAIDAAQTSAARFLVLTGVPGSSDTVSEVKRITEFAASIPMAASMNLQALLAPDGMEVADKLRRATGLLSTYREGIQKLSVPYDASTITGPAVAAVKEAWQLGERKVWPFSALARRKTLQEAMQSFGAATRMDLAADLRRLENLATLRSEMDSSTDALPTSALWRGMATDVGQVEALIRLAEGARAATAKLARDPSALPELRQQTRTLFVDGRELLQPGMPVAVAAETLIAAASRLQDSAAHFASLAAMVQADESPLAQLSTIASGIIARANRLNAWCKWQERREQAMARGLAGLVSGLETGLVRAAETTAAFEVSYARWLAPLLIDARPELRRFSAVEHTHLLDTFRKLDLELAKLAAETIRARVSAVIPAKMALDVPPGFGVLRREVQRRTGNAPVRKLVSEMGEALTRLTPCLLMSPHSVAQFLTAGAEKFDLVVFDEASQIAVWDAIGAIARGRNAIIVGDPKQMPPTNFFGRSADPDEMSDLDATSTNVGDLESILDEGLATGMHHHRLTGHYRSKHESLIAFSNHKYYGGDLVTYPSAVTQTSAVSLRRCAGAYQKGNSRTNPEEAKAVVAEIVTRLTDPTRQRQTIGVVTMNSEQQRLIRNLLDDERRRLPELEAAFKDLSGEEIDMVYNLETVQGHERDVIMLSVGYGPTVVGDRTMSMNFGPLNRAGGERRLNVAVTRAIREVVVFASFDPDMIDLTRTSAQAVHDLKAYLDFASRGPVALARESSFAGGADQFDSLFEEHVATRLRARGWTIQTQIGVSKFRIDLGVVHPDFPGRFLAGVECDGATFHNSPTARDRDRVRHDVLTSLDWALVRLWSTDFFLDPDAAISRIHDVLTGLLDSDRHERARQAESSSATNQPVVVIDDLDDRSADFAEEPDPQIQNDTFTAPTQSASAAADESLRVVFYEDSYLERLNSLCLFQIDQLGPITFVHLSERIARAHRFQRTGSEIKKRVWAAIKSQRKTTKGADGAVIFWPDSLTPTTHVAFRGRTVQGEARSWQVTPYVEKLGLALEIVDRYPEELRLEKMANRVGVERLRAKPRDELVELLESAVAMRSAN